MLLALEVWIAALIVISPAIVERVSWSTSRRFYRVQRASISQKRTYLAGLTILSLGTLIYLVRFAWRVSVLYQMKLPLRVLIALDRSLFPAGLLSALTVFCFFVGRGPHRFTLAISASWVALNIWIGGGIVHWA